MTGALDVEVDLAEAGGGRPPGAGHLGPLEEVLPAARGVCGEGRVCVLEGFRRGA